jgi:CRISPR type IV-associated protein Csf2
MTLLKEHVKIELFIRTTAPLHIACASSGDHVVDENTGRIIGKREGVKASPITRTERKPCVVSSEDGSKETIQHFPYIKANNIAGRLRRFGHDVFSEFFMAKGVVMPSETYRGLSCGAPTGTPSDTAPKMSEYIAAQDNLYMGLFGGSGKLFSSGMRLGDANPVHQSLINNGTLPAALQDMALDMHPAQLTYPVSLIRRDRLVDFDDPNIDKVLENGAAGAQDWLNQVSENPDDKKEGKKISRLKIKNKVAYECVVSGMPFYSSTLVVAGRHDYHVGLLLECLSRLAEKNELGGKSSKGLGRFNMTVKVDGETAITSHNGEIDIVGGDQYLDAFQIALEAVDIDGLNAMFAG